MQSLIHLALRGAMPCAKGISKVDSDVLQGLLNVGRGGRRESGVVEVDSVSWTYAGTCSLING